MRFVGEAASALLQQGQTFHLIGSVEDDNGIAASQVQGVIESCIACSDDGDPGTPHSQQRKDFREHPVLRLNGDQARLKTKRLGA